MGRGEVCGRVSGFRSMLGLHDWRVLYSLRFLNLTLFRCVFWKKKIVQHDRAYHIFWYNHPSWHPSTVQLLEASLQSELNSSSDSLEADKTGGLHFRLLSLLSLNTFSMPPEQNLHFRLLSLLSLNTFSMPPEQNSNTMKFVKSPRYKVIRQQIPGSAIILRT